MRKVTNIDRRTEKLAKDGFLFVKLNVGYGDAPCAVSDSIEDMFGFVAYNPTECKPGYRWRTFKFESNATYGDGKTWYESGLKKNSKLLAEIRNNWDALVAGTYHRPEAVRAAEPKYKRVTLQQWLLDNGYTEKDWMTKIKDVRTIYPVRKNAIMNAIRYEYRDLFKYDSEFYTWFEDKDGNAHKVAWVECDDDGNEHLFFKDLRTYKGKNYSRAYFIDAFDDEDFKNYKWDKLTWFYVEDADVKVYDGTLEIKYKNFGCGDLILKEKCEIFRS